MDIHHFFLAETKGAESMVAIQLSETLCNNNVGISEETEHKEHIFEPKKKHKWESNQNASMYTGKYRAYVGHWYLLFGQLQVRQLSKDVSIRSWWSNQNKSILNQLL